MIDPDKYFVCWRIVGTESSGRGVAQFAKDEAQRICDQANSEYEGMLFHYIMPGSAVLQIARGIAARELAEREQRLYS